MPRTRSPATPASVTIRDVARAAQVSVASVSRVLNRSNQVLPDTRQRITEAMHTLGYVPNAAARSLSTAKTHALGVVLPDLHGEFFGELVRGIDRAASGQGYMLLLSTMHADRALAASAMGAMRGRTDGLIMMAPQLTAIDIEKVLPPRLPAVLINSPEDVAHHNFRFDNRGGVLLMVRHLLATGRRSIVHLAGIPANLDAAERAQAFAEAMATLAPDLPARVFVGDFTEESGERLVHQLLADGVQFDAIFAANDVMALGAMQALRNVGKDVPGEIAVAGFDDIPLARHLGLTTVRVDIAQTGTRAVERLIAELGPDAPPPQLERQTGELVVRATTAAR